MVYLDTASKGDDSYLVTVGDQSLVVGRDTPDATQRDRRPVASRGLQGRSAACTARVSPWSCTRKKR